MRRIKDGYDSDHSVDNFSTDDEMSLDSKDDEKTETEKKTSFSRDSKRDVQETTNLLRKDNRIRLIRATTLLVLIIAAILVSSFVYTTLRASEQREFETRFVDQATHIGNALRTELQSKLQVIDSLSVTTTSYANSREIAWPNVTVPEISYRAASILTIAGGISLALQPVVRREDLESWEQYSVDNQKWITQSLSFQQWVLDAKRDQDDVRKRRRMQGGGGNKGDKPQKDRNRYNVSEFVFQLQDGVPKRSEENITIPLWQHSPVLNGLPLINYNVFEKEENKGPILEVLNKQEAALGLSYELSESYHGYNFDTINQMYTSSEWKEIWGGMSQDLFQKDGVEDLHMLEDKVKNDESMLSSVGATEATMYAMLSGPAVNIWYPVFARLGGMRDVVAVLSLTTKWESFLLPNLPPDPNGLVVVIWNECDQVFTFEITGSDVTYLGADDLHEEEYDTLKQVCDLDTDISTFTEIQLSKGFCPYKATVYPSSQMWEEFESSAPVAYSVGVATIFLFAIAVFILYDFLVERRQKFLAETAHRSSVIVSGLFPRTVRDRLYQEKKDAKFTNPFLTSSNQRSNQSKICAENQIADLYTSTTVMFGDIAGFTAWSSARQPPEVFVLLETLYSAFDKIARRMDVFKVETIGDCYMAVTGLPNPQKDHHLRMVRFARCILYEASVLTKELEATLGPDTANLSFRIGLHSGPVTAGVLRGEKSRFQLFGDTVNTASRMESTGMANRIQASQATADLIAASNKVHWLKKREEKVQAKGKGEVQTYWVKAKTASNSTSSIADSRRSHTSRTADVSSLFLEPESIRNVANDQRIRKSLVDWQIDLMARLLKQIAHHRRSKWFRSSSKRALNSINDGLSPHESIIKSIKMPAFDPKRVTKNFSEIESIVLPEAVVTQLEAFLWTIAKMFHDNSFHNYEHTCQVTMSANKFLKHIVTASIGSDEEMKKAHESTYGLTSDPLAQIAIVFSSLIHDVDHPGVSNQQLAEENSHLALTYGSKSTLEQNSVHLAFNTLNSGAYADLLSFLCSNDDEYKRFRQLVINCVMATDIFDKKILKRRNKRWTEAFGDEAESPSMSLRATVVIELIIQAADVAHTMQHWHVYQKWNQRLFEEMSDAYHEGRSSGEDPVIGWYKVELCNFDSYVIPLANKLVECGSFGACSDECLNYALQNRQEWESKGERVVEEMKKAYTERRSKKKDETSS